MAEAKSTTAEKDFVVIESGKTTLKDLYKKEDWMAVWMGFFLLIVGLLIYLPRPPEKVAEVPKYNAVMKEEAAKAPFKTIEWHNASAAKKGIRARDQEFGKTIQNFLAAPSDWSSNPLDALYRSKEAADAMSAPHKEAADKAKAGEDAALAKAKAAQAAAAAAGFKDSTLNSAAEKEIKAWQDAKGKASKAKAKASVKPFNRIPYLIGLCVILAVFFGIGKAIMGIPFGQFVAGFPVVFFLAILAYMAETQELMKYWGFGFPLWAIVFGLLISNTVGTPKWLQPAVCTEFYIKTGLVLLGAEILFNKILAIGKPGIFVAWICTPVTLVLTYWFGQKIVKMPSKTLNITISADMSVCGVSAAIATAAACRAKKEELTLAIGLSMVFTAICMVGQPAFAKLVGMPEILAGAWMGSTIDSTGAVAAAGAFLGEKALYVAATIKMIQNVLIGVVAFCVAVYWCARVDCKPGKQRELVGNLVPLSEVRHRLHHRLDRFLHHRPGRGQGHEHHHDRPGRSEGLHPHRPRVVLRPRLHLDRAGDQLQGVRPLFQGREADHALCVRAVLPARLHPADRLHHVLHRVPRDHGGDLTA